jgi:hypothetical protein
MELKSTLHLRAKKLWGVKVIASGVLDLGRDCV